MLEKYTVRFESVDMEKFKKICASRRVGRDDTLRVWMAHAIAYYRQTGEIFPKLKEEDQGGRDTKRR